MHLSTRVVNELQLQTAVQFLIDVAYANSCIENSFQRMALNQYIEVD